MRYSFECWKCGHTGEVEASMRHPPKFGVDLECPQCGQMKYHRVVDLPQFNTAGANKISGYPYVSRTLPFNSPAADHYGPQKMSIIRDRQHEARVRAHHNYVGEEKIVAEMKPLRFGESNAVIGGPGEESAAKKTLMERAARAARQRKRP